MQLNTKRRYFNTVGSKEGWTPSAFVSSRNNRSKDGESVRVKQPEDFMDEEDLAEAAELQGLQTQDLFASLGTAVNASSDFLCSKYTGLNNDKIGNKLLYRMGWREGQGIGPKILRKAQLEEDADEDANRDTDEVASHYYAPQDTQIVAFTSKTDSKGLGFISDDPPLHTASPTDDNELFSGIRSPKGNNSKKIKAKPYPVGGFGTGVLNEAVSDDEDPYEIGPRITYNKAMTSKTKKNAKKKPKSTHPYANSSLSRTPTFQLKKESARLSQTRSKCHDGRFPMEGFILADLYEARSLAEKYSLPKVPIAWSPSKITIIEDKESSNAHASIKPAQGEVLHNQKTRAAALGETALPGKSVFDYISSDNRDRIADVSKRFDLPAGLGQLPDISNKATGNYERQAGSAAYYVTKDVALGALHRSMLRGMPYADDFDKLKKYRLFLQRSAGLLGDGTENLSEQQEDEQQANYREFAQTARVFQPISSMMATRFTSSSAMPEKKPDQPPLLSASDDKFSPDDNVDSTLAAAKSGMYGSMTRKISDFFPTRLVCKRFNVQQPAHMENETENRNSNSNASTEAKTNAELVTMAFRTDEKEENAIGAEIAYKSDWKDGALQTARKAGDAILNLETNEALEAERAGDEIFSSIFGTEDQ